MLPEVPDAPAVPTTTPTAPADAPEAVPQIKVYLLTWRSKEKTRYWLFRTRDQALVFAASRVLCDHLTELTIGDADTVLTYYGKGQYEDVVLHYELEHPDVYLDITIRQRPLALSRACHPLTPAQVKAIEDDYFGFSGE